jgi:hypothetical protein
MKHPIHKAPEIHPPDTLRELGQLREEARAALDLAVVALAPTQLVERLATAAGLLEALGGLPADSSPVIALLPKAIARARSCLDDWRTWHRQHLAKKIPRG